VPKKIVTKKREKKEKKSTSSVNLPPKPTRSMSAYLFFCRERRLEVSKTVKSLGEISKELARLWADTDANSRLPYHDLAAKAKVEYSVKVGEWKETCTIVKGSGAKAEKRQPSTRAKRPPTAYMLFCSENRASVATDEDGKNLGLGQRTKRLATMWKDCDDTCRIPYVERATQLKREQLDSLIIGDKK